MCRSGFRRRIAPHGMTDDDFTFQLKPESPLHAMGFKSIDVGLIGLQGEYRKQVVHTMRTKVLPAGTAQ